MFWSKPVSLFPPNRASAQHLQTSTGGVKDGRKAGTCANTTTCSLTVNSPGPRGGVNTATKETNEEINNGWRMKASLLPLFKKKKTGLSVKSKDHVCFDQEVMQRLMSSMKRTTQQAEEMRLMTADGFKPLKVPRQVFKRE